MATEEKQAVCVIYEKRIIPVRVLEINEPRQQARVQSLTGEPFPRWTHGGWAYYDTAWVWLSQISEATRA